MLGTSGEIQRSFWERSGVILDRSIWHRTAPVQQENFFCSRHNCSSPAGGTSPDPDTTAPVPAARTRSKQPAAKNQHQEPAASSQQQAARSKQPGASSQQQELAVRS